MTSTTTYHEDTYNKLTANNNTSETLEPRLTESGVSHPQLLRSSSRQSITVSEYFYSIADTNSEDGSASSIQSHKQQTYPEFSHLYEGGNSEYREPTRNISPFDDQNASKQSLVFSTPPSRLHSPSNEHVATAKSVELHRAAPAAAGLTFDRQLRRKPVSSVSTDTTCASPSYAHTKFVGFGTGDLSQKIVSRNFKDNNTSVLNLDKMEGRTVVARTATPGVDDSPYIRFAIEQLTRDEEVRGTRFHDEDAQEPIIAPPMPVATGYPHAHRPQSTLRKPTPSTPVSYSRPEGGSPAVRWPTEKQRRSYPWQRASRPMEQPLGNVVLTSATPKKTPFPALGSRQPTQFTRRREDNNVSQTSIAQFDVFMPYDNHFPSNETPKLNFLPGILRPLWLGLYIFLCLLMLIGLIFSAVWSEKLQGLWAYRSFGDNRYFTFHYLPTLIGMILLLWLIQIQIAVQRVAPFIAMASESTIARSQAAFLDLYPTQYLYPKIQYFRAQQWVAGACFIVFWVFLITIPLLAGSFNVRWVGSVAAGEWRWVAVQGVIWTVVALYIILIITLVILAVWLRRNETGLKWDPRSIADVICLLERANIMSDYMDSETFATRGQFSQRLWTRADRLGYWHTSRRPQDVFYGIGAEGGAARRYSVEHGRIREKPVSGHSQRSSASSVCNRGEQQMEAGSVSRAELRDHSILERHVPWMLTTVALLIFTVIALALVIAFFAASFIHNAITAGFFPSLRASADADGFSPANFLFTFISCLLGLILCLVWQPLDLAIRRMAVFSALSQSSGAPAALSLLLDYPALAPGVCTIRAVFNRDFLVAYTSFISLISAAIPVLAGGVFWAQYYPDKSEIKVSAERSGWYALCFFVTVYAVSYAVLLIVALVRRGLVPSLPHPTLCLAELLSWLYMSPSATDPVFAHAPSKNALASRLAASDRDSRTTPNNSVREKPSSHNQLQGQGNSPPRLTVRLLGDHSPVGSDGLDTYHDRIPGRVSQSPRNSASNYSIGESVSQHATQPLPPLIRPAGPTCFAFGVYIGRDGQEHLGIDRFVRDGREMVVSNHISKAAKRSWRWP